MKRISIILLTILSFQLHATTTVVNSGETSTTPIDLLVDGDGAIIEEGGTLNTSTAAAVTMSNDNQTALNQGTISTTGQSNYGIHNNGNTNAVITNSGQISTTSGDAFAIFNDGANAVITNSGQISTISNDAHGIVNVGANAVITNSGQISTTDVNAAGINNLNSANAVITNSGQITTIGNAAYGILNSGSASAMIANSGQISTTGSVTHGILNSVGANAVITNSGKISTIGSGAYGIHNDSNSADVHIINSGTIHSAQSHALSLEGANPTLTLLRGSNLQGTVNITGANFTLNVERGLNLALTLNAGSFDNLSISAPFVQVGSTIAVVDQTGLALQADVAADLSDTILDGIYHHRLGCCNPSGCGVWAQGLGSYRKRGHDSEIVGYDNWQGGFLLGYDTYFCEGNLSLFGGVLFAKAEVDESTQSADINNYVGGLSYETCFCDTYLGVAVAAGYVDWDNERFVMNNLASNGVEKARADIDGWFVSPEATLSRQLDCLRCHPILSFNLRYAGLFLGDYHEKGSETNLSVNDREIDLLTTRFEAAIPYSCTYGGCCWSVEPYAGVFGRYQLGGYRVSGELLGQSLDFDQGGPRNLAAFLIGFRSIQSYGQCNLSLNLEASFDTESSSRILGEGRVGWNF